MIQNIYPINKLENKLENELAKQRSELLYWTSNGQLECKFVLPLDWTSKIICTFPNSNISRRFNQL